MIGRATDGQLVSETNGNCLREVACLADIAEWSGAEDLRFLVVCGEPPFLTNKFANLKVAGGGVDDGISYI